MKRSPRSSRRILILGTGGHARVLVSILRALPHFKIAGLLDLAQARSGEKVMGVPVLGSMLDGLENYRKHATDLVLAIGDNAQRQDLLIKASALGFKIPALIHPTAFVDPSAQIEEGAVICAGAIIGACATIGAGAIINTGSIIDHETAIGDYVHVAPGCALAGRVTVGEGSFLGIGARVADHLSIGQWSIIGAGAVVLSNLPDRVTAYGVPAKVQKTS